MQRLITSSLLAAVALFIFGAIYWMSPTSSIGVSDPADDAVAQALLGQIFPETGLYWVPGMGTYSEDPERFEELHVTGPVAMVNIVHDAGPPMAPGTFIAGFIHEWIACFLIALLLLKASPALPGFADKVGFVTLAGFTASFFIDISAVIWWRMPLAVQIVSSIYVIVSWFIIGLILARFASKPGVREA